MNAIGLVETKGLIGLVAATDAMVKAAMAWAGGLLGEWVGPQSFVGQALSQLGLRFVTDATVASVLSWVAALLTIWLLGALLKSVGKKRIEKAFHAAMERIPLVSTDRWPRSSTCSSRTQQTSCRA